MFKIWADLLPLAMYGPRPLYETLTRDEYRAQDEGTKAESGSPF